MLLMLRKSTVAVMGILVLYLVSALWIQGPYEFAFRALSWFKKVSGQQVSWNLQPSGEQVSHSQWTLLLSEFVDDQGLVAYDRWADDQEVLDGYLRMLSTHPPANSWSKEEQMAYWINAYNAFTVRLILDHHPVESIRDIAGSVPMINSPWDLKFFEIGGEPFDLNTIEHEILRKEFNEPRIHFVINCASMSCPILLDTAYEPDQLEMQLERQTRRFINDPKFNRITESEIALSSLFKWYKSDFTQDESLLEFIGDYTVGKFDPDHPVDYLPYDWTLNKQGIRPQTRDF